MDEFIGDEIAVSYVGPLMEKVIVRSDVPRTWRWNSLRRELTIQQMTALLAVEKPLGLRAEPWFAPIQIVDIENA
jgi:hypothetical protein